MNRSGILIFTSDICLFVNSNTILYFSTTCVCDTYLHKSGGYENDSPINGRNGIKGATTNQAPGVMSKNEPGIFKGYPRTYSVIP